MRAAFYEHQGPAKEVITVGEVETPHAGPGEVRVRIEASATNPADTMRRLGTNAPMEFPRVITNSDGAGIVDDVGAGVEQTWLGKRVWLYNGQRGGRAFGTAAEYISLDQDLVTELPGDVPFEAGASLGIPCMTAHRAVFADGPVTGKVVLVTGGAGAVGHYAIQLAKWGGAHVITTISSDEKAKHAGRAGADFAINYRHEDVIERIMDVTDGEGVDRIVEVDFATNYHVTRRVLKLNGGIAFYATKGDPEPKIVLRELMARNITLRGILLNSCPIEARRAAQRDITEWLGSGKAVHTIAARFPLEETWKAHHYVEAGGKLGTVIVEP